MEELRLQERELIEGCLRHERVAQQALYQRYARAMYSTALRIVGDDGEAADVLQDAFVDVFVKLDTFRQESTIGAWIKRIVINKALNALRRKKQHWIVDDTEVPDVADEANASFPFTVEQVKKAMQSLPDGYRTVMSLFLLEDYSHQEIAESLGITVSTSKSQYHRAKERVRNYLETEFAIP